MLQKYLLRLYPGMLSGIVVLAILWLTLAPHPLPEEDIPMFPHMDKVVHALMFGSLVFSLVIDRELLLHRRYVDSGCMPRRRLLPLGVIFIGTALFGGIIELLQGAMALGRGADWLDFAADLSGALIFTLFSPLLASLLLYRR